MCAPSLNFDPIPSDCFSTEVLSPDGVLSVGGQRRDPTQLPPQSEAAAALKPLIPAIRGQATL